MKIVCKAVCILLFLTSCANRSPSTMPDVGEVDEMNIRINITAPEGWNTSKLREPITLQIINLSEEDILFDENYGTRMFIYDRENWVEVFDQITSFYHDDIILQPFTGDSTTTGVITVSPQLKRYDKKTLIRIIVLGSIAKSDGEKSRTGAFIDLYLRP